MDKPQSKIKPFLIGISGGSASGKTSVVDEVYKLLTDFEICTISLDSYYKDLSEEEYKNISEYNFDEPSAFDFDLLLTHVIALRNGESVDMPKYDFKTSKRLSTTYRVKSSPVIIFEGILAFFDRRIRNLMDLKIFIDTDCDVRLSRRIYRDIKERGRDLSHVINRYHKFVKPAYENFIGPTKKYADIIIPRGATNKTAIRIVSEYLKMQLNKILKGDSNSLFSSINDVIDPKYQFYDGKVLVIEEKAQIDFIKLVFQDSILQEEEPELITSIREKMIAILPDTLINHFRNKKYFSESLPRIDMVLTEDDDIKSIKVKQAKIVFFFQTCILTEEDMKKAEYILGQNSHCLLIVNTIFLAAKFADQLLHGQFDNLILNTLYFNDFFIKFEPLIKESQGTFNKTILCKAFKDILNKEFAQ